MPKQACSTGLLLAMTLALSACTSNGQPQERTQGRAAVAQPSEAMAAEPLPADGPTDPGTRYLPVGEPLGQIPVESPPIETSP